MTLIITDYRKTAGSLLSQDWELRDLIGIRKCKVQILNGIDGVLKACEIGCSTMLKTTASEMNGIFIGESSVVNYRGIYPKPMYGQFRGEAYLHQRSRCAFSQSYISLPKLGLPIIYPMASLREKSKVETKAEYAEFAAPLWKQFIIVVW